MLYAAVLAVLLYMHCLSKAVQAEHAACAVPRWRMMSAWLLQLNVCTVVVAGGA